MAGDSLVTRREFVTTTGGVVAGTSLLGVASAIDVAAQHKRRYAIVGTGERATGMWGRSILQEYSDVVDVVGLCDVNRTRAEASKQLMGATCPTFTSFDAMCDTVKPDLLMVTTVDNVHHEFIVKALDRGLDVITEKPMVIDANQCQAVLDAEARNKRKIIVTFNYRYAPKHARVKELLTSGEIGRVLSVDFAWYLDVIHGADYFRRWHRLRNGGGTLFVHKATHHFDLVNWWLGADPVEVVAHGALKVYGKNSPFRHTHCRPCPHKKGCRFHYDMTKDATRMRLYGSAEDVDGYHRDGCVFREDVNIFDTMSAMVTYSNGATMSYALDAHLPYEGYAVAFNGEFGRIDVRNYERQPWKVSEADETEIYLTKSFGVRRRIPLTGSTAGGHGVWRHTPARSDLPEGRRTRSSAASRLARGRDVVSHRHRGAHERGREARRAHR